jgi:hypothetical protein
MSVGFPLTPTTKQLISMELVMSHPKRRPGLMLGFILLGISFAPAPPEKAPERSALAEARHKAALKQFEEVWTYYRQSRTESFPVYLWSRLVLDSQRDLSAEQADRIAALEGHLDRMQKLA